MIKSAIWAGSLLLAFQETEALHFPGIISKDYNYSQILPIKQSYYMVTKG